LYCLSLRTILTIWCNSMSDMSIGTVSSTTILHVHRTNDGWIHSKWRSTISMPKWTICTT
jgi:hypothetical protein